MPTTLRAKGNRSCSLPASLISHRPRPVNRMGRFPVSPAVRRRPGRAWFWLLVREALFDLTAGARARYTRAAVGPDDGLVSLFMAVFFVGVLLLCGVIVDAGRGVHANVHASDLAARAARVGAQQLDLASLRAGTTVLDPGAAQEAASSYLVAHHIQGQATATGQDVTVTVTWPIRYTLLAALRPGATAVQTRTAVPIAGP